MVCSVESHSDKVVMAKFHPSLDLVLTTSVDTTASLFLNAQ